MFQIKNLFHEEPNFPVRTERITKVSLRKSRMIHKQNSKVQKLISQSLKERNTESNDMDEF